MIFKKLLVCCISMVSAFITPKKSVITYSSRLFAEDKEIEESEPQVAEDESATNSFDIATLSSRQKVANQKVPAREFLSESWKEELDDDDSNQEGGGVTAALASAVLAIIFIALAQIPQGNDVSSFSYDRSNKPMSPSEIASIYKSVTTTSSESE
uniref:PS II complex 12 kDa extrinsic protein n=1 Tax=Aureoumbra lagunensis TaxID=44058 RepID=A0A7S3JVV9_9STRA|mmetsp:Transcript_17102/g.22175  ORF Transcript_17102/g.22175 Transcript_17102/m.22175 type:complete len:155 (+) Transcript_17102:79-543(+)|eukprot:CAMPEP_0197349298 /NCGR_PEP_ID=MMETSP0893-20130614/9434_1 /TAXON_ID=44058 ORGANISM="Aureoumbra lagunensis, Strain CCMP1510" /NCGR_SAMPLE_ID=MMETSP0893 /ASSEMBLY_ACC=CAM_ASM_000539 /LENGTH=154 /DNA_ID=CAMNT_0042860481 /DNA_START=46 /DNA_END=510 /DNA_ORIENTATION=-